jgi:ArsR family transcriptional regulator
MTETLPPMLDPEAVARVRERMPSDEVLALVIEALDALADPARARILYALAVEPLSVRDLAALSGVSESAASHHLRVLRDCKLVDKIGEGPVRVYSLADHHIAAIFQEAEYHADHRLSGRPDHPYGAHLVEEKR